MFACLTSSLGRVLRGQCGLGKAAKRRGCSLVVCGGTKGGLGPQAPPGLLSTVKLLRVLLVFTNVTITGPPGPPALGSCHGPNLKLVYQNASLSGAATDGAQGSN